MSRSSFFFFVLCLGMVFNFALCNALAGTPTPKKAPRLKEREVRVCLKTQTFEFYEKGELSFWGPVCTGMKKHETPKGTFRALKKYRKYFSKKYDGAPMPFAVQFSTCGCFLHVGAIANKPSSHGCVRLNITDAERIFAKIRLNDPITIE